MMHETDIATAYRILAAEVVRCAYMDYVLALQRGDRNAADTIEKFFRSQWCYELIGGKADGEVFIQQGRKAARWKSRVICDHISRR